MMIPSLPSLQYHRRDVASFHQFAVEPQVQWLGIGTSLIEFAERRAAEMDAVEIALDTLSMRTT